MQLEVLKEDLEGEAEVTKEDVEDRQEVTLGVEAALEREAQREHPMINPIIKTKTLARKSQEDTEWQRNEKL